MSEWLKEHAWKACVTGNRTWVRIPLKNEAEGGDTRSHPPPEQAAAGGPPGGATGGPGRAGPESRRGRSPTRPACGARVGRGVTPGGGGPGARRQRLGRSTGSGLYPGVAGSSGRGYSPPFGAPRGGAGSSGGWKGPGAATPARGGHGGRGAGGGYPDQGPAGGGRRGGGAPPRGAGRGGGLGSGGGRRGIRRGGGDNGRGGAGPGPRQAPGVRWGAAVYCAVSGQGVHGRAKSGGVRSSGDAGRTFVRVRGGRSPGRRGRPGQGLVGFECRGVGFVGGVPRWGRAGWRVESVYSNSDFVGSY